MLSIAKLLIFALIGCAVASPVSLHKRGKNIIIAYRKVSEGEAKNYRKAGTVTPSNNLVGRQLGTGVYTASGPNDWPGNNNDWTCVIFADEDAIERVSKAWIPRVDGDDKELWFRPDRIDKYIKDLEDSWDPAKTLRFSRIDGLGDKVQMLIPHGLLNSRGGSMGISVLCDKDAKNLPSETIDWADGIWEEHQEGDVP